MTTTQTAIPTGTWQLDLVHSSVGFAVDYLAGTFKGTFRDADARLEVGERTTLEGSAKVATVDVKDENLAAHLQGPDFFDAERNPELRFSGEVTVDGGTATVRGEITIKGTTRPLTAAGTFAGPLTDPYGRERVSLTLTTTVDRTEFGVNWNAPLPTGQNALANEVTIHADLQFTKAA